MRLPLRYDEPSLELRSRAAFCSKYELRNKFIISLFLRVLLRLRFSDGKHSCIYGCPPIYDAAMKEEVRSCFASTVRFFLSRGGECFGTSLPLHGPESGIANDPSKVVSQRISGATRGNNQQRIRGDLGQMHGGIECQFIPR